MKKIKPLTKPYKDGRASWSLDDAIKQIESGKHGNAIAAELKISRVALYRRAQRTCKRKYLTAISTGTMVRLRNAIFSSPDVILARARVNREYGYIVANVRNPTRALVETLRLARAATKPKKSTRKRVDAAQQKVDLEQV